MTELFPFKSSKKSIDADSYMFDSHTITFLIWTSMIPTGFLQNRNVRGRNCGQQLFFIIKVGKTSFIAFKIGSSQQLILLRTFGTSSFQEFGDLGFEDIRFTTWSWDCRHLTKLDLKLNYSFSNWHCFSLCRCPS